MKYAPLALLCALPAFAAEPSISKIFDKDLTNLEHEFVPLAEAMPADKYDFAPTGGEFKGVRTFAQEVSHVATVIYEVSAGLLGEKNPVSLGEHENGAPSLKTKDDIVKYLKDSMAYGHKAIATLTPANLAQTVPSPFGSGSISRVSLATITVWHSYDHYGQMVVYARLNGVIPPASR